MIFLTASLHLWLASFIILHQAYLAPGSGRRSKSQVSILSPSPSALEVLLEWRCGQRLAGRKWLNCLQIHPCSPQLQPLSQQRWSFYICCDPRRPLFHLAPVVCSFGHGGTRGKDRNRYMISPQAWIFYSQPKSEREGAACSLEETSCRNPYSISK